jgi:hypothetical protein
VRDFGGNERGLAASDGVGPAAHGHLGLAAQHDD